jgi:hypothetical protein
MNLDEALIAVVKRQAPIVEELDEISASIKEIEGIFKANMVQETGVFEISAEDGLSWCCNVLADGWRLTYKSRTPDPYDGRPLGGCAWPIRHRIGIRGLTAFVQWVAKGAAK